MSELEQIARVRRDIRAIEKIKNPSEAVQLAAVEQYSWAIVSIKNPTEKVQIAAVTKCPYHIGYIDNPCEAAQIVAVLDDARNIEKIRELAEGAVRALMKKNFPVLLSVSVQARIKDRELIREINRLATVRDVHDR